MQKFDKKMLVPLLSAIALILKYILQVDIPDVAIDLTADIILGSFTLYGMFAHMFEKKSPIVLKPEEVTVNETAAATQPNEPTVYRSNK